MNDIMKDVSPMGDISNALSSVTGMPQGPGLDAARIVAYVLFGAIGFVAFMYGKKNQSLRPAVIGVLLMGYPYFVTGTLALYLIGIALTAALYFWRD